MRLARQTLFFAGLAICMASAGFAQSLQDRLTQELIADGYTQITVSRTLLGRVRIVAEDGDREREIIFNPRSGIILRDYYALDEEDDDHDDDDDGGDDDGGDDDNDDDDGGDDDNDDEDDDDDDEDDDGDDDGDDDE